MRDFNDVTEQMNNIIDWYRNLSMDYTGINDLMYQRIQLITLLSYYATELGDARIEFKNAEAETERVRRTETKKYLDAGFPITQRHIIFIILLSFCSCSFFCFTFYFVICIFNCTFC